MLKNFKTKKGISDRDHGNWYYWFNWTIATEYAKSIQLMQTAVSGQSEQSCGGNCEWIAVTQTDVQIEKRILTEPKPPEDLSH
jgi:hypothetical protein